MSRLLQGPLHALQPGPPHPPRLPSTQLPGRHQHIQALSAGPAFSPQPTAPAGAPAPAEPLAIAAAADLPSSLEGFVAAEVAAAGPEAVPDATAALPAAADLPSAATIFAPSAEFAAAAPASDGKQSLPKDGAGAGLFRRPLVAATAGGGGGGEQAAARAGPAPDLGVRRDGNPSLSTSSSS